MNVNFNLSLLPHQKLFRNCTAKEKALVTGYGGGKSLALCFESLVHSMLDRRMLHMLVSPSYKMAKSTLVLSMQEIFEDFFDPPLVKNKHYTYNKTDFLYEFPLWNGIIKISSAQDPDSLKGPNIASFGVDEPGITDFKKVRHQLIARLRHPKAQYRQGFYGGTPEGINDFSEFVEGEDRPSDFEDFRGHTRDNKFLPDDYIETLYESYDSLLVEAYLCGKFVNLTTGTAYHEFGKANVIEDYDFDPDLPILIGMDFNYTPNTAVASQEKNGKLIVFKEFWYGNCDTDAKCERIRGYFQTLATEKGLTESDLTYIIYPDAAARSKTGHGAGKSDLIMVRNAFHGSNFQVRVRSSNPLRADRLNAVNGMLCNGRGERRLFIHKSCKKLQKDMRQVPKDEFLGGNIKEPDLGHITDGLGYLVQYRYPIKNTRIGERRVSRYEL